MEIQLVYNISLNESEARDLGKILGYLSNIQKQNTGLNSDGIESMRTLWKMLPDGDEE